MLTMSLCDSKDRKIEKKMFFQFLFFKFHFHFCKAFQGRQPCAANMSIYCGILLKAIVQFTMNDDGHVIE